MGQLFSRAGYEVVFADIEEHKAEGEVDERLAGRGVPQLVAVSKVCARRQDHQIVVAGERRRASMVVGIEPHAAVDEAVEGVQ